MTTTTNGKPTSKALALASIRDAMAEAARTEGIRPVVIDALLTDALDKVLAIQELVKPRRVKPAAAPVAP